MFGTTINTRRVLGAAIGELDPRAAQILKSRYGLYGEDVKTLSSLGISYGLTRERIRQIEESSLSALRGHIDEEETTVILGIINEYLNQLGNLRRVRELVRDLRLISGIKYDEDIFGNELRLLAEVMGEPYIVTGDNHFYDVWHNDKEAYKTASTISGNLRKFKEHDFDKFMATVVRKFELPEIIIINYLSISKYFDVGPYGDLGANHWLHVQPKTVRDKSFLVLKKTKTPLHFREISNLINKLNKKKNHPATTVHNELIKDPRFILVGRGTYALKERLKK